MTYLTYNQYKENIGLYRKQYFWNRKFLKYGNAIQIHRKTILIILTILCLVTPFTNWMIPFLNKLIKNGFVLRW